MGFVWACKVDRPFRSISNDRRKYKGYLVVCSRTPGLTLKNLFDKLRLMKNLSKHWIKQLKTVYAFLIYPFFAICIFFWAYKFKFIYFCNENKFLLRICQNTFLNSFIPVVHHNLILDCIKKLFPVICAYFYSCVTHKQRTKYNNACELQKNMAKLIIGKYAFDNLFFLLHAEKTFLKQFLLLI